MNARGVEGPLMPLDKPPAKQEWAPQFAPPEPAESLGGGHGRAIIIGIGALLAIGALLIAWQQYRRMINASPKAAAAVTPAAPPTTVATPPPAPTDPAATQPPASTLASAPPTPLPRATPAPPRAPHGTGGSPEAKPSLATARTLLQKGQFPEAARGFAASLKGTSKNTYSVQLLVACSAETIQKAVSNVTSQELFIVPVKYKGHDCYRVCWGMYETETRARSAAHGVPDYFRKGGARPKAVPASLILP
jgi:septal ring-binding cell division protein DamX